MQLRSVNNANTQHTLYNNNLLSPKIIPFVYYDNIQTMPYAPVTIKRVTGDNRELRELCSAVKMFWLQTYTS